MSADTTSQPVLLTETSDQSTERGTPSKTLDLSDSPAPDLPHYEDPYEKAVTYMEKHHILHVFRVRFNELKGLVTPY